MKIESPFKNEVKIFIESDYMCYNTYCLFPNLFQSRFERKKKFVAIRSEVREKQAEAGDASTSVSASYHMASQYLAESSLTEDLNKYEFSMSGSAQVRAC